MSFHSLASQLPSIDGQADATAFLSLVRPFNSLSVGTDEKEAGSGGAAPPTQTQATPSPSSVGSNLLSGSVCLDLSGIFESRQLGPNVLLSPQFFHFVSDVLRSHLYVHSVRLPAFPASTLAFSAQNIFRLYGELLSCIEHSSRYSLSLLDMTPALEEIFAVEAAEWFRHSYIFEALKQVAERIDKRMQRNRERIFGIHGGGNIGMGMLANVVCNSRQTDGPGPFRIVATTGDRLMRSVVNAMDEIYVRHTKRAHTVMKNITLVDRDNNSVVDLYRNSVLVGMSLTPAALQASVSAICQGLLARYHYDSAHLHVLCLFNQPNSAEYVRAAVHKEMEDQCKKQPKLVERVMASVTFHATVIDQIINKLSVEDLKAQMKKLLLDKGVQALEFKARKPAAASSLPPRTPRLSDASTRFYASFAAFKQVPSQLSLLRSAATTPVSGSPLATPHPMPTVRSLTVTSRASSPFMTPMLSGARHLLLTGNASNPNSSDDNEAASSKLEEQVDSLFMQLAANSSDAYEELAAFVKDHQLPVEFFDAEDSFTFVCAASFPFLKLFPLIRSSSNLAAYELLKNRYFNAPHAVVAWLGALRGYRLIAEAIADEYIGKIVKDMMLKEIAPQLLHELNEFSEEDYQRFYELFVQRCLSLKTDTCLRVGRDPLRKLNKSKRTMEYIQEHQLPVPMGRLQLGIAAGILYSLEKKDPDNAGVLKICELCEESKGDIQAVLCYHDEEFDGFHAESDKQLLQDVLQQMNILRHDCMLFRLARRGLALNDEGQLYYLPSFKPLQVSYELLFVRHGSTHGNEGQVTPDGDIDMEMVNAAQKNSQQRVFQGNVDSSINQLTGSGREQAEHVAQTLTEEYFQRGWRPDIIFHSPLSRARDTGMPFVELHNMQDMYLPLDDLHEMSFGQLENRRVCDLAAGNAAHSFYQRQNAELQFPNGGESFCQVLLRATESLQALDESFAKKKILAFSHSMFGAACLILFGKGRIWLGSKSMQQPNGAESDGRISEVKHCKVLAFDGVDPNGVSYTMPHTTPMPMNFHAPKAEDGNVHTDSSRGAHLKDNFQSMDNPKMLPICYPPNALLERLSTLGSSCR